MKAKKYGYTTISVKKTTCEDLRSIAEAYNRVRSKKGKTGYVSLDDIIKRWIKMFYRIDLEVALEYRKHIDAIASTKVLNDRQNDYAQNDKDIPAEHDTYNKDTESDAIFEQIEELNSTDFWL